MAATAVAVAGLKLPDGVRPGVATGQRVTRLLEYAKCNQFGECAEEAHPTLFFSSLWASKDHRAFRTTSQTRALARKGGGGGGDMVLNIIKC